MKKLLFSFLIFLSFASKAQETFTPIDLIVDRVKMTIAPDFSKIYAKMQKDSFMFAKAIAASSYSDSLKVNSFNASHTVDLNDAGALIQMNCKGCQLFVPVLSKKITFWIETIGVTGNYCVITPVSPVTWQSTSSSIIKTVQLAQRPYRVWYTTLKTINCR